MTPAVAALEAALGDPRDPTNPFSYEAGVAGDEVERFPEEAIDRLTAWGLPRYFVPDAAGGALGAYDELYGLVRTVSRRDVTIAIATGKTFLGAVTVWIGGTAEQQGRVARIISGGGRGALALTERAHGSDLAACEVTARPVDGGYRLSGEKWLINNGATASFHTVLARTNEAGGPGALSLVLVEAARAPLGTFEPLPKIHTLGVRGADISGARFNDLPVKDADLVGEEGKGLELLLKGMQLSKTLCAALSLGAADTALGVTLEFLLSRELYGDQAIQIPQVRRGLADTIADLWLCESLALLACRCIHLVPEQMSVLAAVVKWYVPTTVESVLQRLSVLLGARYYLREEHCAGVFQKVLRDAALISFFDGNTAVNLAGIASQLRQLLGPGRLGAQESLALVDRLASFDEPLPPFDPRRLALTNKGALLLVETLPLARERLHGMPHPMAAAIAERLDRLEAERMAIAGKVAAGMETHGLRYGRTIEASDEAARFARLTAGMAGVWLWIGGGDRLASDFRQGAWLVRALDRLLPSTAGPDDGLDDPLVEQLIDRHRRDLAFAPFAQATASQVC